MKSTKTVAILVPCYNEESRFDSGHFIRYINDHKHWDFYFVDDGSTDKTRRILKQVEEASNSYIVQLPANKGKGNALREAFLGIKKQYDVYGFIDADLDIPLAQLDLLMTALYNSEALLAIGTRDFRLNFFKLRSFASLFVLYIANRIIKLEPKISDTQCGCKLFKQAAVKIVLKQPFISSWLFDIEIFARLNKEIPSLRHRIQEVPLLNLNVSKKSNLKYKEGIQLIRELRLINKAYN